MRELTMVPSGRRASRRWLWSALLVLGGFVVVGCGFGLSNPPAQDLPLPAGVAVTRSGASCGSAGCSTGVTLVSIADDQHRSMDALADALDRTLQADGWIRLEDYSWTSGSGRLEADLMTPELVVLRWPDQEGFVPSNDEEMTQLGAIVVVSAIVVVPTVAFVGTVVVLRLTGREDRRSGRSSSDVLG